MSADLTSDVSGFVSEAKQEEVLGSGRQTVASDKLGRVVEPALSYFVTGGGGSRHELGESALRGRTMFVFEMKYEPSTPVARSAPASLQSADDEEFIDDDLDHLLELRSKAYERVRSKREVTTPEDVTRLSMLTDRLRILLPRVTPTHVEDLTKHVDAIEALTSETEDIEKQFGLR